MSDIDYTTERWLPVAMPGYQDFYDVSDHGRVRSRKRINPKILCPYTDRDGYQRVYLSWPINTAKSYGVHRLVLLTFIGPPPTDDHEVAHNDGVPGNNRISNLRWSTRKENAADKTLHGTLYKGSTHHLAKLSESDIANIFKLRKDGLTHREIAKHYPVTESGVGQILCGTCWKHLNNPKLMGYAHGETHHSAKLKNADILRIHELRSLGYFHRQISELVGISESQVGFILQGKRWAHLMPTSKSGCADGLQLPL